MITRPEARGGRHDRRVHPLPDDPEFRAAFASYIEWGTRIALANSQPDAKPPLEAPMPHWGWGVAPPYIR